MRRAGRAALVCAAVLVLDCASPAVIVIEAGGPDAATLRYRRIDPVEGDPFAGECATPCRLSFDPAGVYELELRASGHAPARLTVAYDTFLRFEDITGIEPSFVVPMLSTSGAEATP